MNWQKIDTDNLPQGKVMDKNKKINFLKVGYQLKIDKLQKQIEELTVKMEEIDIHPTPYFYNSLHPRKEKKNLELKIDKIREEIKTLTKEIEELEKHGNGSDR